MGICPQCKKSFPDDTLFCPDDGEQIPAGVQSAGAAPAVAKSATEPSNTGGPPPANTAKPPPANTGGPPPVNTAGKATSELLPPVPEAGWVIDGKYVLEKKLGEGGMGAVWRAKHSFMDKPVALKLLRPQIASSDEAIKRFAREAKLASQLDEPHCVMLYDCGKDAKSGTLYLAMEYLEGQSLRGLLDAERRVPVQKATQIFVQLLEALGAAHQIGIVHRDVKPENVFLVTHNKRQDFVKLLDFGIAKQPPQGAETQITKAGFTVGTPEYIAPEQAFARPVDGRTDLYSAGVIFYEMIVGRRPFTGDTPLAIVNAHVSEEPPAPKKLAPDAGISKAVEQIVLKILQKEPKDRFQDAESCRAALIEAVFGVGAPAMSTASTLPAGSVSPLSVTSSKDLFTLQTKPASLPPAPSWMRPAFFGLVGVSGLLLLGLLILLLRTPAEPVKVPPEKTPGATPSLFGGSDTSDAEAKLNKGDYNGAIQGLLSAMQQEPKSPKIRTLLATAYASVGQWGEARAHIEVAKALDVQFRAEEATVDLALGDMARKDERASESRHFLVNGYGVTALQPLERALKKDDVKRKNAIVALGDLAATSPKAVGILANNLGKAEDCKDRVLLVAALSFSPKGDQTAIDQLNAEKQRPDIDTTCKSSNLAKAIDNALATLTK